MSPQFTGKAVGGTTSATSAQPIKINLKFQQSGFLKTISNATPLNQQPSAAADQPLETAPVAAVTATSNNANNNKPQPGVKKSRFSQATNVSNVIQEQTRFKQQQEQHKPVIEILSSSTTNANANRSNGICSEDMGMDECNNNKSSATSSSDERDVASAQSDIVYDINKWPASLKTYCASVYQHYQKITLVSEDQVTKYLQKRITDAFKENADLNSGWQTEPIPDVLAIKKVNFNFRVL